MEIKTNGKRNIILPDTSNKKKIVLKDINGDIVSYIKIGKNGGRITGIVPDVVFAEVEDVPLRPVNSSALNVAKTLDLTDEVNLILEKQNAIRQAFGAVLDFKAEIEDRFLKNKEQTDIALSELAEVARNTGIINDERYEEITAIDSAQNIDIEKIYSICRELSSKASLIEIDINNITNVLNAHEHEKQTKESLGLGKVDNTSDIDKPVSKAVQEALDEKVNKEELTEFAEYIERLKKRQGEIEDGIQSLGGICANPIPIGGKVGDVLMKRSDLDGDFLWAPPATSENATEEKAGIAKIATQEDASAGTDDTKIMTPLKVATVLSNESTKLKAQIDANADAILKTRNELQTQINGQATSITEAQGDIVDLQNNKQDVIFDLDTIRSGAGKGATAVQPSDLSTVATSGSYNDLSNKPTIPDAQVQSDWTESDNTKVDYIKNKPTLATVATSGSYNDLSNKPTIPSAQVNADWDASSGVAQILNKPTLATVATSGSYNDLSNKPSIPQALSDIAVAGDNVTFKTPSNIDYVASSNKINSPSIVNGLFTTTSSSYLQINNASISNYSGSIFTGNYSWAWTVKFKTPASFTKAHRIFMFGSSVSSNPNMWAGISEDSSPAGSLAIGVHNRDAWNSLYDADSPYILETDTWYWLRVSRDVSTNVYKAEVSTDGVSWITAYSFVNSYAIYDANSTMFISQVSSSYDALEYDLTGVSFTSNYAGGINWVAYIHDERTSINATAPSITVDQTYNSASSNPQSGVAINGAGFLKNSAAGSNSLTILGNATGSQNSVNIGAGSRVSGSGSTSLGYSAEAGANRSTAIGSNSKANGQHSIGIGDHSNTNGATGMYAVAIGSNSSATQESCIAIGRYSEATGISSVAIGMVCKATANYAIQLGNGTNSTANTLSVGLSNSLNVRLLNSDGTIPYERLPIATSVDSTSTNSQVVGAKLFYDTCGNITDLINAL